MVNTTVTTMRFESHLGSTGGDALVVVLMDSGSGTDAVRVVYNDTDALQVATKRGAQLATLTHTGTVDLDSGHLWFR